MLHSRVKPYLLLRSKCISREMAKHGLGEQVDGWVYLVASSWVSVWIWNRTHELTLWVGLVTQNYSEWIALSISEWDWIWTRTRLQTRSSHNAFHCRIKYQDAVTSYLMTRYWSSRKKATKAVGFPSLLSLWAASVYQPVLRPCWQVIHGWVICTDKFV